MKVKYIKEYLGYFLYTLGIPNKYLGDKKKMKKVTLILPDKVTKIGGTSRTVYHYEIELTPEDIIKIFCESDYHSRYKFEEKDIRVISIEDYSE